MFAIVNRVPEISRGPANLVVLCCKVDALQVAGIIIARSVNLHGWVLVGTQFLDGAIYDRKNKQNRMRIRKAEVRTMANGKA